MDHTDADALFLFLLREPARSKNLTSDGLQLRRNLVVRTLLAEWEGMGVALPDLEPSVGGPSRRFQDYLRALAEKLGLPLGAVPVPPPTPFTTPKGRAFSYEALTWANKPRFPDDTLWSKRHAVLGPDGNEAGSIFYSPTYGLPCTFHGSLSQLRWSTPGYVSSREGSWGGYDTGPSPTLEEALAAWGRSADFVLDWADAHPPERPDAG